MKELIDAAIGRAKIVGFLNGVMVGAGLVLIIVVALRLSTGGC